MISELKARLRSAVAAYAEEDAATASTSEALDVSIAALHRLIEQNNRATSATRVAYNFRGGMTQGGEDALRTHDQIRETLDNQLRALVAVKAGVEKVSPLVTSNTSIAERMLGVVEG